ncbi:hypothetical protein LOK49_LG15G01603 [Camellia lanceoleosa]|uniref:Uncharacterized protein n=1 Tax=Camellia lanceoleosa TaxID=1840588 RepID=A0ACC0F0J6_9ERIC|nr:hypothetical protein LOK49_LG15G01603 [Camellia lanceoleosa]
MRSRNRIRLRLIGGMSIRIIGRCMIHLVLVH